jgi:hypothetical protein
VAAAIITSDTHAKELAISFDLGEHRVRLGGCVKGAGMISPSMATMLCFITTDAQLPSDCLRKAVLECVEESFNRITIDGDMSTNDTVLVLANGASGMPPIRRNGKRCKQFRQALRWLMLELAKAVVRDGERVTKFVTVQCQRRAHLSRCEKGRRSRLQVRAGEVVMERRRSELGPHHSRRRLLPRADPRGTHRHPHRRQGRLPRRPAGGNADGRTARGVAGPEFEDPSTSTRADADYTMYSSDLSPGIHRFQPLGIRLLETGAQGRMGPTVKVELNDQIILRANLDDLAARHPEHEGVKRRSGHIGFLGHGDRVAFRKIHIGELPPVANEAGVKAAGFTRIFDGKSLQGWKHMPETRNWYVTNSILKHDGEPGPIKDLWTEKSYKDFTLVFDWRWSGRGPMNSQPLVQADGSHQGAAEIEEFDSGIYLRGNTKSQVNLWNWNVGSGEVYGYRMDPAMPAEVKAAVTPRSAPTAPSASGTAP